MKLGGWNSFRQYVSRISESRDLLHCHKSFVKYIPDEVQLNIYVIRPPFVVHGVFGQVTGTLRITVNIDTLLLQTQFIDDSL